MTQTEPSTLALRVLLLAALALAAWLVAPFADAVLVAAVVAVLAWPFHARVLRLVRGHRLPATGLTLLGVTIGVVVPVGLLLWLVSRELALMANQLMAELDKGELDTRFQSMSSVPLVGWGIARLGGAVALANEIGTVGRKALANLGQTAGQYVPGLLALTARALLKTVIFYLTLGTLFHRGDKLMPWAIHMSPLRPASTLRLTQVFTQFARNVVLAGVASAIVQGVVAGIGYLLAGVERPLLFALLTGVMAFVPLVGTAVAWVPVTLLLLLHGHPGGALFVALWSLLLTGTIDNIVKPLVVRGNSDMPALLVFLGVFGGLAGFGIIGLLVGPVVMALMLALLHIYEETLPPQAGTDEPQQTASSA